MTRNGATVDPGQLHELTRRLDLSNRPGGARIS
jgi:hypothetical protein